MARATAPGSATALVAVEVPTVTEGAGWWNRVVGLDDATDDAMRHLRQRGHDWRR